MTGYITSLRNNPAVEFGCPRCGELHEHIRGAVECCAITTELRESMIAQALAKHSRISTCAGRDDLYDSFTVQEIAGVRFAFLWYNDPKGSTRTIVEEI